MATIEIPKVRKESTVIMYVSLTDNGVTVDWTSLSEIKPFMYSDEQHCIAGKCTAEIATGAPETLIVRYPTTAPQFLGQNSLLIRCTYDGNEKSFDVPVLEFVDRSSEATGVTVIEDPELPVAIEVQDVDTSVLDDAIAAALDAAAKATAAAELVPLDILAQCQAAAEAATAAAENASPRIAQNGNWEIYDFDEGEYVDSGNPSRGIQGIQGEKGDKGDKGDQGNTGSSVAYPYELVNNLTTDDATKGLSAAQGVALAGEISQLDQKVAGLNVLSLPVDYNGYINGSGAASANSGFNTVYIPFDSLPDNFYVLGRASFMHWFTAEKVWISLIDISWSDRGFASIKKSEAPATAGFLSISWQISSVGTLRIIGKNTWDNETKLTPFTTALRNGTARYATAGHIAMSQILPFDGARGLLIRVTKAPASGCHFKVGLSWYKTVTTAYSLGIAIDGGTIEKDYDGALYIDTPENAIGFCVGISQYDGTNTLVSIEEKTFAWDSIEITRVYIPTNLEGIADNDAYTRNRDRDNMLAAAVRMNKTATGSKDFMPLLIADSHNDAVAENNAVVIANGFQYIQALLHLGDICAGNATDFNSAAYDKLVACIKPFYFVVGNHDVGNSKTVSSCITNAQAYTRYIAPLVNAGLLEVGEYESNKPYYFHDFTDVKIRLIVPYEEDDPNDTAAGDSSQYRIRRGDSVISKTQAEWFCDTLASTPAGYGIVVALHNPFSPLADCVTSAKFNDPAYVGGYGSQRLFSTDFWADAVNAWYNKEPAYNCTMVCTGDAEYLNVNGEYFSFSYDFSDRASTAKFICFFGGHVHKDCVWRHRNYDYQYQISPICANTTNYVQCPEADIRRTPTDGPSKDSLTAVGIDIDNIAVRLVKIGVNVTENMTARDYEKIAIGNTVVVAPTRNGSRGNSGNQYAVFFQSINVSGANKIKLRLNRPLDSGCSYVFCYTLPNGTYRSQQVEDINNGFYQNANDTWLEFDVTGLSSFDIEAFETSLPYSYPDSLTALRTTSFAEGEGVEFYISEPAS